MPISEEELIELQHQQDEYVAIAEEYCDKGGFLLGDNAPNVENNADGKPSNTTTEAVHH